jgi:hypothetical protein
MPDDWRRTEDDVSRDIARLVKVLTRKKKPVTRIPTAGGTGGSGSGGGMPNPMTTPGDMIRGGTTGSPVRLPIGTAGQFLRVVSGLPAWSTVPLRYRKPVASGGQLVFDNSGDVVEVLRDLES